MDLAIFFLKKLPLSELISVLNPEFPEDVAYFL